MKKNNFFEFRKKRKKSLKIAQMSSENLANCSASEISAAF